MLRGQIERHKEIFKEKIRVGKLYRKIFKNYFNFSQVPPKNFHSVHWLNSIILDKLNNNEVKRVGEKLMKIGVEIRSGFWPLINTQNIKSIYVGKEKVSQQSYNRIIVLPSNYGLKEKDILFIKNQLIKIIKSVKPSINFNK
jgi:dTDP-4-amino-4,6-dideoxygalactose transaminase